MATSPAPKESAPAQRRLFGRARRISLIVILVLLGLCVVFGWVTRDAMEQLSFLKNSQGQTARAEGQKTIVDVSPWQTAETLAPLARSEEEQEFAQQAERLADHEVDQAFAAALRQATARVQAKTLTGDALALSQRVASLEQLVKGDEAQVASLTPPAGQSAGQGAANSGAQSPDSDDLEIAKAQLALDSDQLDDLQKDLARAIGDDRGEIQTELAQREAEIKQLESQPRSKGQGAVSVAGGYGTLAAQIRAWSSQRSRYQLIVQARQHALDDAVKLTTQHNALETQANSLNTLATSNGAAPAQDHAAKLANLKQRSAERQLLGIYDDRIQTEQQLAVVYQKWAAQVTVQHRIVLHLIVESLAWIAFLIANVLVCDAVLGRLLERSALDKPGDGPNWGVLDRRRMQTLRTILQLGVQVVGGLLILLVVFGTPQQMPTILGLATAGITVVLQDFIIAFFGWFVLMGKHGMRVGDRVEIDGAAGEVAEIGLFRTTVLETGNWTDKGHPTGRRITVLNSFAIRGQYFNFSTDGQWMWDEIQVSLPAAEDSFALAEQIRLAVAEETKQDAAGAEQEWKRSARQNGLSQFSAETSVNLRPSGAGVDLLVRYVTRANDRYEARNRIYQRVVDLLQKPVAPEEARPANPS